MACVRTARTIVDIQAKFVPASGGSESSGSRIYAPGRQAGVLLAGISGGEECLSPDAGRLARADPPRPAPYRLEAAEAGYFMRQHLKSTFIRGQGYLRDRACIGSRPNRW